MATQALTFGLQAAALGTQLLIKNLKPDQSIHGLTLLFAVAVLSRSVPDSRISAKTGKITIQPPGMWTSMIERPLKKDERKDLLVFNEPIDHVCKIWNLEDYPQLKPIYEAAKKGFERLESLPKWDPDLLKAFHQNLLNIELTLQSKELLEKQQKENIKAALESNNLLAKKNDEEIQKIVNDMFIASKKPKSDDPNIEKYKNVWSKDKLDAAITDFGENDIKTDEAIMCKLDKRERDFNAVIKSMSSINPT